MEIHLKDIVCQIAKELSSHNLYVLVLHHDRTLPSQISSPKNYIHKFIIHIYREFYKNTIINICELDLFGPKVTHRHIPKYNSRKTNDFESIKIPVIHAPLDTLNMESVLSEINKINHKTISRGLKFKDIVKGVSLIRNHYYLFECMIYYDGKPLHHIEIQENK